MHAITKDDVKNFLIRSFNEGTWISKSTIFTTAVVGGAAHFGYYFAFKYIFHLPYESLTLRLTAVALCLVTLFKAPIEKMRIGKFFRIYWHIMLIFVLPFFFALYLLKNNFHELWLYWGIFMIFILIIHVPNWFMFTVDFTIGVTSAIVFFVCTDSFQRLTPHFNVVLYGIVIFFSVTAGLVFQASNKRLMQDTEQRVRDAMSELAGSIAHEMRNPLGQIQYSLDSIGHALPLPSTAAIAQTISANDVNELYLYLSQGNQAITRGLQVISMTLDEVNAKTIDTTGFSYLSAAEVTQKAIDEYCYASEDERNKVKLAITQDFFFKGDETIYLFVLFNLIKNALYYFKLYPAAALSIVIDHLAVVVTDTGPGIPKNVLSQLFEAFHTVGKSGGTGLGLAYCRRAMRAFGGEITCCSVVGQYTEFTLRFPEVSQREFDIRQQAMMKQAAPILKDKHILIVDDDQVLRMVTRHMLNNVVAGIDEAENGQIALHKLEQKHYDLIVMDLNMPVLDGYATTEMIRSNMKSNHRNVPIVAYSSELTSVARVKTAKVGMDAFVNKPGNQWKLVQALWQACKNKAPEDIDISFNLTGKTVLLADDDAFNRVIVSAYLRQQRMHVIEVEHGQAVLDRLATGPAVDVLIMDIHMPGLNGLQTAQAIRANRGAAYRQIPICALTGDSGKSSMQAAFTAGINEFIVKPIVASVLFEKLERLFNDEVKIDKLSQSGQTTAPKSLRGRSEPASSTTLHAPLTDISLIDTQRLEQWRSLDLLDELLSDYLVKIPPLLERLDVSLEQKNFHDMHQAMHSLLGISGNIGGMALYRLIKRFYIPVADDGCWPAEHDWLPQIKALTALTVHVLRTDYVKTGQVSPDFTEE